MRDDAAPALRAEDDMPRPRAELRSVSSFDDAYAELRARASERRFERTPRVSAMAAVAGDEPPATVAPPAGAPAGASAPPPGPPPGRGSHDASRCAFPARRPAAPTALAAA